ncbi:hypothetical protein BDZ91DRAFT_751384 [Kalaharituber pfeilii]|nr:hypothetical protein BDZ91DRAFT_751384 [Kalaharituber pfeilii]
MYSSCFLFSSSLFAFLYLPRLVRYPLISLGWLVGCYVSILFDLYLICYTFFLFLFLFFFFAHGS